MTEVYNDIYAPITAEQMANIPEEMRAEKRWICWGSDKVPVSAAPAKNGKHYGIDITNPKNWGTFEQAAAAIGNPAYVKYADENFHIVGVGFVVGDSWFCADMDGGAGHKKEDVPQTVVDFALANTMRTYAEKSLSGCGYHFFGKCDFDTKQAESNQPHRDKNGNPLPESYEVEFFTRRKFIAVTGNIITGQPAANTHAIECSAGAYQFYTNYILNDWRRDEEKRAAERAEKRRNIPVNRTDAEEMFLMNYPEILAAANVDNFKRGGPGVKLANGQYSWIAALKAMHEIGIPDYDIIEWCRKGSSFRSEKDVLNVIYKKENTGTASVAGIIKCAQENGWKPDPEKLTGEYKKNHEEKMKREADKQRVQEEYQKRHRAEHAAQLADLGIDCAGDPYRFEWTLNFDGSIQKVIEKETGEIVYEKVSGFDVRQANANAESPSFVDPAAPWEPIVKGKALPRFPLEQFPAWIQEHIKSFAAVTGVSADYCAAAVLGTISAVTVGHCVIPFNGTHREPIQLYSIFTGSSGTMKSSVIRHFMEPANEYLRKNNDKTMKANYAIKKEIESIEKEISIEKKAGKKANLEKIRELTARIDQKRQERHSSFPVPWDDVTPESLLTAMNFSRGTANIATAEGNIINVICGRSYTQRGAVQNIDVFLKGADGESIHNFRVTSGEIDIPRADISMLLAIQPGLLERLCTSADAISRGLAQRFLIYAPEDTQNAIDHTAPVFMDPAHIERWNDHIKYIAARFMDPDGDCKQMPLEPAADRIIREFWNYESQLKTERGPGDDESITSWIGKLHGKALRVAALLALLRDKDAQTITKQDAEISIYLFKQYYIPHFIGAFEHADNLTREQRQIVNWITRNAERTGRKEQFTQRELWMDIRQRSAFAGRLGRDLFAAALAELQEKNYIRPAALVKTPSGRGRPGNAWQINPELYTN